MKQKNKKIPPVVFLRGRATVLRPLSQQTDLADITRWINDQEIRRNIFMSFPSMETSEAKWFDRIAEHHEQMKEVVLAIETLGGKFIGTIGIHNINWKDRTATTGMLIGEAAHRGKGYGTDAKMILLDYAFNTLGLRKICSSALAFNVASQRCLEKCGYRREGRRHKQILKDGEYHDEVIYGCFERGWLAARMEWFKEPVIHGKRCRNY